MHALAGGKPLDAKDPETHEKNGVTVTSGTELLAQVGLPFQSGQPLSVPDGAVLAMLPVNPRYIDGARVSKIMQTYAQYRARRLVFEYTPIANAFTAGQLVMAFIPNVGDPFTLATGFQAVRNAASRPGAVLFQVTQQARAHFEYPLLKWYNTSEQTDEPQLSIPGFLVIMTTQPLSSDGTGSAVPYGMVSMHYEIELRSPTIEGPVDQAYYSPYQNVPCSSMNTVAGQPFTVDEPSWAAGSAGVVWWGTIAGISDGTSPVTWRDLLNVDGEAVTLTTGQMLFMRTFDGSLFFYTSFGAAQAGDQTHVLFGTSASNPPVPGAVGFKLWSVMGAPVSGFAN